MKSFVQIFLFVAATFATVHALETGPAEKLPSCPRCVEPHCSQSIYTIQTELKEVNDNKNDRLLRTFQTSLNQAGDSADLIANFFYEGGRWSLPPAGTITSFYKQNVIVKIDLETSGYPLPHDKASILLKIDSGSEPCTTALDGFVPFDIKKITAATDETLRKD